MCWTDFFLLELRAPSRVRGGPFERSHAYYGYIHDWLHNDVSTFLKELVRSGNTLRVGIFERAGILKCQALQKTKTPVPSLGYMYTLSSSF